VTEPRSPGSYSKILDAASRVIEERGYHGSTVQHIADAAQLTKGGVYYYLRSKEEALFGINERILQLGLEETLAVLQKTELPVEERLWHAMVTIAAQHDTYTPDLRVALREFSSLTAGYREKVIELRDQLEGAIKALLVEGINAGIIVDESPELLSKYIFGALNWMSVWFHPSGAFSGREIGEAFARYTLNGLLAPSASSATPKSGSSRSRA
jgi:AcrR family transcriptional regulator